MVVAQQWGIVDRIPPVPRLRVPDPSFDFLSFDEADRLIQAADGQFQAMILVALRTGLRQGELLGLQWPDIDFDNHLLSVRQTIYRGRIGTPKNGRIRVIPIESGALQALRALSGREGHKGLDVSKTAGYVFHQTDGTPLTDNLCKHPIKRACKRAGIRRVGWHVLRHTFASHLVMKGVNLRVVQELLGHSTITMTMRYAHLNDSIKKDAVALLGTPPHADSGDGHDDESADIIKTYRGQQ